MKHLYKLFTLLLVASVLVSCNRDQGDTDYLQNRDTTIFFASNSFALFVEEGAQNIVEIPVGATQVASSDIPYTLTVDPASTAVEGVDFNILGSGTSFSNGNIISVVRIQADFDNAVIEGKVAILNLSSGDAGVSDGGNQFTLELFKFCPFEGLDTTSYTGTPTVPDLGYDGSPTYVVTVNPVPGTDNQWTVSTAWGPDFVWDLCGACVPPGSFPYSATIVLNDDFTIDVIGNDAWATGGSGSFSPCTQEFTYTLTQGLFTGSFGVDVVLTPN